MVKEPIDYTSTENSKSVFLKLIKYYKSGDYEGVGQKLAERMLNDPKAELIARALDMELADYFNIMLKIMAVESGFLDEQVSVVIKNGNTKETVFLTKDDASPLTFRDLVGLRSGPLFGGVLNPDTGKKTATEAYDDSELLLKRSELVDTQLEDLKEDLGDEIHGWIKEYYARPFDASRVLSDIDMVAQSLEPLENAIARALEQRNINGINPKVLSVATQAMWQNAGYINVQALVGVKNLNDVPLSLLQEQFEDANTSRKASYTPMGQSKSLRQILEDNWANSLRDLGIEDEVAINNSMDPKGTIASRQTMVLSGRPTLASLNKATHISTMQHEQELTLGEAMEFEAPTVLVEDGQVKRDRDGNVIFDTEIKNAEEYGDVILDAKSFFGGIFDHKTNFETARKAYVDATLTSLERGAIGNAKKEDDINVLERCYDNIYNQRGLNDTADNRKNLAQIMLSSKNLSAMSYKDEVYAIADNYIANMIFIDDLALCEEAAKKEAQTVDFNRKKKLPGASNKAITKNTDKIVGNISDTALFVFGVNKMSLDPNQALANSANVQLELMKLSYLLALPRWGVVGSVVPAMEGQNLHIKYNNIGGVNVASEEFADSLNRRSYQNLEGLELRKQIGWADINLDEAQKRLDNYHKGFNDMWEFTRNNDICRGYFQALDAYQGGFREYYDEYVTNDEVTLYRGLDNLKADVKNELQLLIEQHLPSLVKKVKEFVGEQGYEQFINNIAQEATKSVEFSFKRELIELKKRNVPVAVNDNNVIGTEKPIEVTNVLRANEI